MPERRGNLFPIPPPTRFQTDGLPDNESGKGKDIFRFVNVSKYLYEFITKHNAKHEGDEVMTYQTFTDDCTHRQRNTRAKNIIASLLNKHLVEDFGTKTYCQSLSEHPREMENLIELASQNTSLPVFSQTENHWAIRKLIEERMETRKRSAEAARKSGSRERSYNIQGRIGNELKRVSNSEGGIRSGRVAEKDGRSAEVGRLRTFASKSRNRKNSSSLKKPEERVIKKCIRKKHYQKYKDCDSSESANTSRTGSSSSGSVYGSEKSEEMSAKPLKRSRSPEKRSQKHAKGIKKKTFRTKVRRKNHRKAASEGDLSDQSD